MSLIYTDGSFKVATAQGKPRLTYPFTNDRASFVAEQDFMQEFASWRPLPLSTPLKVTINKQVRIAYLVEETPLQDVGGGICKWTRVHATIPASRTEWESFTWTKPGLGAGALYAAEPLSSGGNAGGVTVLVTTGAPTVVQDDFCIVRYTVRLSNGNQVGRRVFRKVISVSGNDVTVALITERDPIVAWVELQKVDWERDPLPVVVPCMMQLDYWLPGVTPGINNGGDIPINYPPLVLDTDGKETQTYDANSTPNRTLYLEDVKNGVWLIGEASTVRVWRGNIHERLTRYVKAM